MAKVSLALIVEDSQFNRTVLKSWLNARFPSVIVLEAEGVAEGFQKAAQYAPELVFMDIQLPDGNGLTLMKTIKQALPDTTVIVCTGHDYPAFQWTAAEFGANCFLSKWEMEDLDSIRTLVEQAVIR